MTEPAPLGTAADPQATALEKSDSSEQSVSRKKNKVRAAWISFVGRILAQLIGAAATILLGLMVVDRYRSLDATTGAGGAGAPMRQTSGLPSLAVLPVADYSGGDVQVHLADGLTESLVAHLAQVAPTVRVLSRTSSMAQKGQDRTLPAIARDLAADWIVESSVVRVGARTRLTAQVIDAKTDEHIFARFYDTKTRDLLALQTELAAAAARDIHAALAGLRQPAPAAADAGRN